ncbi:universal stress protein [Paenisporosarcina antarctica]|uniref:Universal stress protein n=1 Tax=Paenisporosarcina antarctica TaxID=417367 RepID=A0A4P7A328_9BACL|nr:universal stress protein [Paenisporosarcina antarctica]QBP42376.1 universal stress protein [Paenisporosarcina antarctica]
MYSKILLASDGSNHALRAAESALKLVTENFTKVTLLYIVDPNRIKKAPANSKYDEIFFRQKREEKLQSTEDLFIKHGVAYEVKMFKGDPEVEIIKFVNHHPHEILIMGSRGLSTLQEMVLGSVSHKVMKMAKCPVMVVK